LKKGRREMNGPVRHAAENMLPLCPICLAAPGDPCRTRSRRTRYPHRQRPKTRPTCDEAELLHEAVIILRLIAEAEEAGQISMIARTTAKLFLDRIAKLKGGE
jgi:hypothetical protein